MTLQLLQDIKSMMIIVVIACMIVFVAMMIDLGSGLYKAKLRGEIRTSQALKRTISKFLSYEGSMLIAAGIDMLIHYSRFYSLFGLDILVDIPVATTLIGIFLLIVEFLSVREHADQKTKNKMNEAASIITETLNKDGVKDALAQMISSAIANSGKKCEDIEEK